MNKLFFEYWQLPREGKLLLDLAVRKTPEQLPEDLDWAYFDALLKQHRIQPLLLRALRSLEPGKYPELDRYRAMQGKLTRDSMARLQTLAAVNAAFSDSGIRLLSMKGPLLSVELYGDPSMRSSRDLDLMVDQGDLKRAGAILEGMGFVRKENPYAATPLRYKFFEKIEHEKHEVYHKGELCLELHWQSDYQTDQSFDALWAGREERQLLGRSIAVMGPADRFPALIIHAAEHGFLRLRWLLDLYELQKKPYFSWEQVYNAMHSQGVGEILLETMLVMYRLDLPGLSDVCCDRFRLTRTDRGVALETAPELAEEACRAAKLCEAVYPLLLREVRPTEPEWKAYDRCLPTSMYGKTLLQQLLLVLGPTKFEFELIDLPDWLFWLYFLIRPFNWLRRKLFGGKE